MKCRQLGYHHLVFPDGRCEDMVVVKIDEHGRYISHHPLHREECGSFVSFDEEAMVEWIGGTFVINN